jgi:hypothetical protein
VKAGLIELMISSNENFDAMIKGAPKKRCNIVNRSISGRAS